MSSPYTALGAGFLNPTAPYEWMKAWEALSPEQKQQVLNSTGEIAGGTVGGYLASPGIVTAAIGAGGGAVLGRSLAHWVGRMGGLPGNVEPTVAKQLKSDASTFALNATGEVAGRLLPPVVRSAKAAVGNVLKRAFTPSEAAAKLVALARAEGIPINLAQASDRPWLNRAELLLDRMTLSTGKIRDFRLQQAKAWEDAINRNLDALHAGEVSPEEFVRTAQESLKGLRSAFSGQMEKRFTAEAAKYSPTPVTAAKAGGALEAGLTANRRAMDKWAGETYGPIREAGKDLSISLAPAEATARELQAEIANNADIQKLFPAKATSLLRNLAGEVTGESTAIANPETVLQAVTERYRITPGEKALLDNFVSSNAAKGASLVESLGDLAQSPDVGRLANLAKETLSHVQSTTAPAAGPTTLTLPELLNLRSELLFASRHLDEFGSPTVAKVTKRMLGAIDQSMEAGLKDNPLLPQIREANATFGKLAQALRPPAKKGLDVMGNPVAGTIAHTDFPEDITGRLIKPGSSSRIRQAEIAASPTTVPRITGSPLPPEVGRNPMDLLRRNYLDELRAESLADVPGSATGAQRLSPTRFAQAAEKMTPQTGEALLGRGGVESLQTVADPTLRQTESLLYESPFAGAVERGDPASALHAAFPPGQAPRASEALSLMPGQQPVARRAYVQNMMESTRRPTRGLADETLLDPAAMEHKMQEAGETFPAVAGPETTSNLQANVSLGKDLRRTLSQFGQPSPAVASYELMRVLGAGVAGLGSLGEMTYGNKKRGMGLAGVAGVLAAPSLAAKAFLSPTVVNWASRGVDPVRLGRAGGTFYGTMGRLAAKNLPSAIESKSDTGLPQGYTPVADIEDTGLPPGYKMIEP